MLCTDCNVNMMTGAWHCELQNKDMEHGNCTDVSFAVEGEAGPPPCFHWRGE